MSKILLLLQFLRFIEYFPNLKQQDVTLTCPICVISLKLKKYAKISEMWFITEATPNRVGEPP